MKTYPVIEIFGPTVQGEGALAGVVTHFVRFGGCDYRCSWCDSLYAVLPEQVRENARKLGAHEIVEEVLALGKAPWVTFSGGNPALLDLGDLTRRFRNEGIAVAVETQGSRWRDWLGNVDCLTVSPKPPSSGMVNEKNDRETALFMYAATDATDEEWVLRNRNVRALKIVVFDETDFQWAEDFIGGWQDWPAYLSVGTDQPDPMFAHLTETRYESIRHVSDRYRWLCERVCASETLSHVRVLPQLHVLAWGHAKGV